MELSPNTIDTLTGISLVILLIPTTIGFIRQHFHGLWIMLFSATLLPSVPLFIYYTSQDFLMAFIGYIIVWFFTLRWALNMNAWLDTSG